jgi:hypothetical protein
VAKILNKTARPLKVPLPGGKFLRLAPRRSGEVNSKALQHPPLQAMVEDDSIEVIEEGRTSGGYGGHTRGISDATGHDPDRTIRKTGDG